MLFQLYIYIATLCILLVVFDLLMMYIGVFPHEDIFTIFKEINDSLEEINNPKLTEFINNLVNFLVNNPIMDAVLVLTICIMPIINIIFLISEIRELYDKFKKGNNNEKD